MIRMSRCGKTEFSLQNKQIAIQVGANLLFAFADIIPGFATEPSVQLDLVTLLIAMNFIGFSVLTWTLCTVADL